jgi:hypothetical protein
MKNTANIIDFCEQMALDSGIVELTSAEITSQVPSYLKALESVRLVGGTNKRYRPVTIVSYGSSVPFRVDIQTFALTNLHSEIIAGWYNSCINIKMKLNLPMTYNDNSAFTIPICDVKYNANDNYGFCFWIRFKDGINAIAEHKFMLQKIGKKLQNNGMIESYLTNICSPDSERKHDIFPKTIHESIGNNLHLRIPINSNGWASTKHGSIVFVNRWIHSTRCDVKIVQQGCGSGVIIKTPLSLMNNVSERKEQNMFMRERNWKLFLSELLANEVKRSEKK